MELFSRTVSALPLSIGTSLALESLFKGTQAPYDPQRPIPQFINVSDYQECWINLETMLRNISGAAEKGRFLECKVDHIVDILLSEIEIINSVFQNEGSGLCKPVFYFCTYNKLKSKYKNRIEFRQSTTILQKDFDTKVDEVLKKIIKQSDTLLELDSELPSRNQTNALIVTHYPYDLVSYSKFKKLDLLESHTGVLKVRKQWNSKFAPMGENILSHLPFYRQLLLIFGDRTLIHPHRWKVREMVYDISLKDKWTPFTTLERIEMSYRSHITHPADLAVLLGL